MDYIFSMLTHTKVVLIAGNHDYLKPSSYYLTYEWNSRVYPLLSDKLEAVEFEELGTCVYGLSYTLREIKEALYDNAFPKKRQPIEILLAHGGDDKHIPINKKQLGSLGYDYVALGHIHLPMEVEKNRMYYAGALEPTDKNDVGPHGYIRGEIRNGKTRVQFVPFASREYIHMEVPVEKNLPGRAVRERVEKAIQEKGIRNIYKIILTGFRDADMTYDLEGMDRYGNILEFIDDTLSLIHI